MRRTPWPKTGSLQRFHIRVGSSGLERKCFRTRLNDAGTRIVRPTTRLRAARYGVPGRVRYRAHCADLTPSPRSRCGCRPGYVASLAWFGRIRSRAAGPSPAACTAGQAGVGWRSIGRGPTAISLKNNSGGHPRGRPCLVGRAMTVTDHAAALSFRAVARDRHPTPACTASARGYESALAGRLRAGRWGACRAPIAHPRPYCS
jgi:hypothetical protein